MKKDKKINENENEFAKNEKSFIFYFVNPGLSLISLISFVISFDLHVGNKQNVILSFDH